MNIPFICLFLCLSEAPSLSWVLGLAAGMQPTLYMGLKESTPGENDAVIASETEARSWGSPHGTAAGLEAEKSPNTLPSETSVITAALGWGPEQVTREGQELVQGDPASHS